MTSSKPFAVTALLLAAAILPGAADARQDHRHDHHRHSHYRGRPAAISYLHNYGPGGYYDGPATYLCYRGAAAYLGQDNRRHPCN